MNTSLRKATFVLSLIFAGFGLMSLMPAATAFEGIIEFTKVTGSTEIRYKYYVKGDKVRIEDFGTDGSLQGIMLVDSKAGKVIGISPERKLFMDMPNNRKRKDVNVEVKKTGKSKSVAGYTCNEWVVNCKDEDRVITYWMADGGFDFFMPMLTTLNRADKLSTYFLKLGDAKGLFPMMGEEKKGDGTVITTLKVSMVKKQTIEASLMEIPAGYTKYDK